MCSVSEICVMWSHTSPVVFGWQIFMTPKGAVPVRGLSDSWDPCREELQDSQVIGGEEIPSESVQRLVKRKWCNFVENSNISVSMGIQSSFWHRDRSAFWKTADDKEKRVWRVGQLFCIGGQLYSLASNVRLSYCISWIVFYMDCPVLWMMRCSAASMSFVSLQESHLPARMSGFQGSSRAQSHCHTQGLGVLEGGRSYHLNSHLDCSPVEQV